MQPKHDRALVDVSVLKQHSFSREFSPLCGPLQFASLSGACSVEHSKVTKFRKGRESSTEERAEIEDQASSGCLF